MLCQMKGGGFFFLEFSLWERRKVTIRLNNIEIASISKAIVLNGIKIHNIMDKSSYAGFALIESHLQIHRFV